MNVMMTMTHVDEEETSVAERVMCMNSWAALLLESECTPR